MTNDIIDRKKILVVEDEGIVALDICQMLTNSGYEVVEHISRAEEVLISVKNKKPDLVLMDINLAGKMDGIQASELLYKELKIPVVFLTAHADEATLQRAKITHPYGFILKPFEADDLRVAVEIALFRKEAENGEEVEDIFEEETDDEYDFETLSSDKVGIAASVLQQINLFKGVPITAIQDLAQQCSVKNIDSTESLTEGSEKLSYGFIVLSGNLVLNKTTVGGKELTVDILPSGDAYGVSLALSNMDIQVAIRAQAPSKLLLIPKSALLKFVKKYPHIHEAVVHELTARLEYSQSLSMTLAHDKVENRIAAMLLALIPRIGKESATKGQPRLYITRKELADFTGTTPETAIRVTKNLERQQMLDLTKPGIIKIISTEKLEDVISKNN